MSIQIEEIPVGEIVASPWQPRKHFDEKYLSELADSIKIRGVIQPITVRKIGDKYELVVGECRWRASVKAGRPTAPALIRELSDTEAREITLIENLQRKDLDLLEEAQGYADALTLKDDKGKSLYTVESLANRLNKSARHLRQFLSLIKLPPEAINALRDGRINFTVGRLLSSVPGDKMRLKAVKAVLHPDLHEEPLNSRQTAELLSREFMRSLAGAPFDQEDVNLVPVVMDGEGERCLGGACSDCPFKTGNRPDEFGVPTESRAGASKPGGKSAGTPPNICTNLECFAAKSDAAWEEARSAALKAGKKVLSDAEAEKLFPYYNSAELSSYTGYVELSVQIPREALADRNAKRVPSWKNILETAEVKPEIVVVRDPKGRPRELVDRRQAEAAIKLAAKKGGKDSILRSGRTNVSDSSEADRKEKERKKLVILSAHEAMSQLGDAISKKGLVPGFWAALLELCWRHVGSDGFWMIGKRLKIEPKKVSGSGRDYEDAIKKAWSPDDHERVLAVHVIEALSAQALKWGGVTIEGFPGFLELYGLSAAKITADVKDRYAEEKKAKAKKPETAPPTDPKPKNIKSSGGAKTVVVGDLILDALKKAGWKGLPVTAILEQCEISSPVALEWFNTEGKKLGTIKTVDAKGAEKASGDKFSILDRWILSKPAKKAASPKAKAKVGAKK